VASKNTTTSVLIPRAQTLTNTEGIPLPEIEWGEDDTWIAIAPQTVPGERRPSLAKGMIKRSAIIISIQNPFLLLTVW
jgi:hypothetical protein